MERIDDGPSVKLLTSIDEYTNEALAIYPAGRIRPQGVIDLFAEVMVERGVPEYIRWPATRTARSPPV